MSRTERDTTPSVFIPTGGSMTSLVSARPRVGFSPTRPHIAAGIRIDPEMSLAWAAGTIRAATAAADPPDEPPGDRSRSHGLWVGPYSTGSVVPISAISGVFVRPIGSSPVERNRRANALSVRGRKSRSRNVRTPMWYGSPASRALQSLSRNGTPGKGPSSGASAASRRARSNCRWITALSAGFSRSVRAIAASTSSIGFTSPRRTSSPSAVASRSA